MRCSRTLTIVLLCTGFNIQVIADTSGYSFDKAKDYLAPAAQWPAWQHIVDQHRLVQQPNIQTCSGPNAHSKENEAVCTSRQLALVHVITRGESLPDKKKLELVNRFVNKRRYRKDRRSNSSALALSEKGSRNSWSTLETFLKRGGDCEDFASAKYFILREMGFKSENLRIVVGWNIREHAYHARLAVQMQDKILWLENDNSIMRFGPRSSFRYIYSLNEENIWDHSSPEKPKSV